jgi:NADPH:quinone reductase-like Zn-dependent oxidoreductase
MKAILCTKYGGPDVLQFEELEKPAPGHNDVLIKIYAATVTMGDCELRSLTLPLWTRIPVRVYMGYSKPRNFIPGMEFSGVIEAVGRNVGSFKVGDEVFGSSGMGMGANAEYICRPGKSPLAIKPKNISFEAAATIPVGGINALHFLRKANIRRGQKVLIIGGGGAIGSYGVMLAKDYGAHVTAVDSTAKLEMLRLIGADHVVDYTLGTYLDHDTKYDVIFDTVYQSSFSQCLGALNDRGVYLMANTGPWRMLRSLVPSFINNKRAVFQLAGETVEDLSYLADLIRAGRLKPFIDKSFPLERTAEAHRYVDSGNKKGCVIINVFNPPHGHDVCPELN